MLPDRGEVESSDKSYISMQYERKTICPGGVVVDRCLQSNFVMTNKGVVKRPSAQVAKLVDARDLNF